MIDLASVFAKWPTWVKVLVSVGVTVNCLVMGYVYMVWQDTPAPKRVAAAGAGSKKAAAASSSGSEPQATAAEVRKQQLEEERQRAREWAAAALPKPKTQQAGSASPKRGGSRGRPSAASASPPPSPKRAASSPSPGPALSRGSQKSAAYEVGTIVSVGYRSVPGEPIRPGGEGRVTGVTPSSASPKGFLYNVAYFQGGRELNVAEKFLSTDTTLTTAGPGKRSRTPSKMVSESRGLATPGKKKN